MSAHSKIIDDFRPMFERLAKVYRLKKAAYPDILENRRNGWYNWRAQNLKFPDYADCHAPILDAFVTDSEALLAFAKLYTPEVLEASGVGHAIRELLFITRQEGKRARKLSAEHFLNLAKSQPDGAEFISERGFSIPGVDFIDQFDAYVGYTGYTDTMKGAMLDDFRPLFESLVVRYYYCPQLDYPEAVKTLDQLSPVPQYTTDCGHECCRDYYEEHSQELVEFATRWPLAELAAKGVTSCIRHLLRVISEAADAMAHLERYLQSPLADGFPRGNSIIPIGSKYIDKFEAYVTRYD